MYSFEYIHRRTGRAKGGAGGGGGGGGGVRGVRGVSCPPKFGQSRHLFGQESAHILLLRLHVRCVRSQSGRVTNGLVTCQKCMIRNGEHSFFNSDIWVVLSDSYFLNIFRKFNHALHDGNGMLTHIMTLLTHNI